MLLSREDVSSEWGVGWSSFRAFVFSLHFNIHTWTGLETQCPAFGQVLWRIADGPWGRASSWIKSISVDDPVNHSHHPVCSVSKSAKTGSSPPLCLGLLIPVPVPCALLCQHSCLSGELDQGADKAEVLLDHFFFLSYYSPVRAVFLTWLLCGSTKSWTCRKQGFCRGAASSQVRLVLRFRICLNQKKRPSVKAIDN